MFKSHFNAMTFFTIQKFCLTIHIFCLEDLLIDLHIYSQILYMVFLVALCEPFQFLYKEHIR